MNYKYYVITYQGIDTLYRIQEGRIGDFVGTLEVYSNGGWHAELMAVKFFMNQYVTGWLDEKDGMEYASAMVVFARKIDEAKQFAIDQHGPQKYGAYPYEIHLINVVNVLMANGILPATEENIELWCSAWLHDILEDTSVTKRHRKNSALMFPMSFGH